MSEQQQQQREIAIFWDYENVPLPDWCNATQAAKAIVDAVVHYGRIVDRRLYYDFEEKQYRLPRSSFLDSSGFDLVNTPTRNNKETLDKKMIADVLTFAWDSAVRNDNKKPCVVLLTGDGDYAYTLSKLRDRGIMTIVMVGRDCTVASVLVDTADIAMSLEDDVLTNANKTASTNGTHASPLSKIKTMNSSSSIGSASPSIRTSPTSGNDAIVLFICRSVERAAAESSNDDWADLGGIALFIQQELRRSGVSLAVIKEEARKVRQEAESSGFIETGRRILNNSGKREITSATNNPSLRLSNEVYIRLLPKGQQLLNNTSPQRSDNTSSPNSTKTYSSPTKSRTTLFLPRIPGNSNVRDFVETLETTLHVTVRRARMDTCSSYACNAHVEFVDEMHANKVLFAANRGAGGGGICYRGKYIGAMVNTKPNPFAHYRGNNERNCYENNKVGVLSSSPMSKENDKNALNDDSSGDAQKFCYAAYLAGTRATAGQAGSNHSRWVAAGSVGDHFRRQLSSLYLQATTKEDINIRYKEARRASIQAGFVEMGRRKLDSSDTVYVAVALDQPGTMGGRISPEYYFRLLPQGETCALEMESEVQSPSGSPTAKSPTTSKCVYMNNVPRSATATQLAHFLETLDYHAQHIEFKETWFKGSLAYGAHVQFLTAEDADGILCKCKSQGGLVYCGRSLYCMVDRGTPDQVNNTNPDMTYTKQDKLDFSVSVIETELTESSVRSEVSETGVEDQEQHSIESPNEDTKLIMRQDSCSNGQKDPFEDLISWMDDEYA